MSIITFTKEGIFCPQGNFYIDPWLPVDYAVITHGHSDHARSGMQHYLCHDFTKPILQWRLGRDTELSISTLPYNKSLDINGVKLSLHPAGHVVGSAQVRLEYKGHVAVISGDYKTQFDGISTAFEPVRCHTFVTESTFGLPIYRWKTNDELSAEMQGWVRDNQAQNKTSVFLTYSLGKAQRVMKSLESVAPLFVHSAVQHMNDAIASSGITLPPTTMINLETDMNMVKNNIVLAPPALDGTAWLKKIPRASVAVCSGWMQVRGSRRWQAADAGFAVSDHADWPGLLDAIKQTGAEKVFVTHGSTAAFSKYLNESGVESAEVQTKFGEEESASAN